MRISRGYIVYICFEKSYKRSNTVAPDTVERFLVPIIIHCIIQEVALAREVCLHVNNNVLLLDSAVMDRMESLRKQNRLRIPSALKWSTCRTIEAGIVACLQAAMKCNATDPRDEVYAVLSLMEPQARSLIPVDYSLDLDPLLHFN